MAAQAQRAATAAALQKQNAAAAAAANAALIRNRGRQQQPITKPQPMGSVLKPNQPMRPQMAGGMVLPNNFQFTNSGQFIQVCITLLIFASTRFFFYLYFFVVNVTTFLKR